MSVKIMGAVWEMDLPRDQKLILLSMADHADHNGENIFPGMGLIAWKTGYSLREVQRTVREIESTGVLVAYGKGPNGTTKYRIDLQKAVYAAPYEGRDRIEAGDRAVLLEWLFSHHGHVCWYCEGHGNATLGPDDTVWHVDRIKPGSKGGRYTYDNIALSCAQCNQQKSNRPAKLRLFPLLGDDAMAPLENMGDDSLGLGDDKNGMGSDSGGIQTVMEPSDQPLFTSPLFADTSHTDPPLEKGKRAGRKDSPTIHQLRKLAYEETVIGLGFYTKMPTGKTKGVPNAKLVFDRLDELNISPALIRAAILHKHETWTVTPDQTIYYGFDKLPNDCLTFRAKFGEPEAETHEAVRSAHLPATEPTPTPRDDGGGWIGGSNRPDVRAVTSAQANNLEEIAAWGAAFNIPKAKT